MIHHHTPIGDPEYWTVEGCDDFYITRADDFGLVSFHIWKGQGIGIGPQLTTLEAAAEWVRKTEAVSAE